MLGYYFEEKSSVFLKKRTRATDVDRKYLGGKKASALRKLYSCSFTVCLRLDCKVHLFVLLRLTSTATMVRLGTRAATSKYSFLICFERVVFVQRPPRELLVFLLKNSSSTRNILHREEKKLMLVIYSYPRLTLDFHTNKRLIDEVVRFFSFRDFIAIPR